MADGPLTNLANLKGRTDANGYLIVTINGGTILAADGTQALPGIAFTADTDTGFWRSAANTMNWITGGGILLTGSANISIGTGVNLLWTTDNGTDIGASGATRPRTGYFGTSVVTPLIAVTTATLSSKITTYNGVVTTAQGVPSIYGSGSAIATTGAIASLATYTVGASNAEFEIAGHVDVTTATTHAFTMVANYTDPAGTTRAQTLSFMLVAGGALVTVVTAASGTVPYNGVPQRIRCKATTAITILTTGTLTTVTYDANASIIQVN